jgi:hypothetical protein
MEKNKVIKGTSINIIQLNVRGQLIPIYTNNLLFQYSERLKNELTKSTSRNYPIYLDIAPDAFHSIISYFKILHDLSKRSNSEILDNIRELFINQFKNNPLILSCFVYLEMSNDFIKLFIKME